MNSNNFEIQKKKLLISFKENRFEEVICDGINLLEQRQNDAQLIYLLGLSSIKLEKFEDDLHRQWLVELGYDINKYYVDKHTKEIKEIVEEADELGADPNWNILQDVESESSQEI